MKTCSRCGVEKPAEGFYKASRTKDGLSPWCKKCHTAWDREWSAKNPEKRRAYSRAYYQRNQEARRQQDKDYRERKPEVCHKARRRWEEAHPGYRNMIAAKIRDRNRREVFEAYGGICACCGEAEPTFLTIDHIDNDGAEHRRLLKNSGGSAFFAWLRQHNFPTGFQVLCRNCNWGKHANGGICPHKNSEGSSTIPSGSTLQATGSGSADRPVPGR